MIVPASWLRCCLTLVVASITLAIQPAAAAEPNELAGLDSAIKLIPDDAVFYGSMLRNREQYEAVVGSRALKRIRAMPVVSECVALLHSPLLQLAWQMYISQESEPGSVRAQIQQLDAARKTPQAQSLASMLADMLSNEVFVYCDATTVASVGLPGFVAGFRLTDTNRAGLELGKLQLVATVAGFADPKLNERLKIAKIGDHYYVVLSLDGTMVDWKQVPLDWLRWFRVSQADIDRLVAHLSTLPLVVAVGLRDDYLLLSVGPSTDALTKLGQGKRLVERPELKVLARFADRRFRAIHYLGTATGQGVLAYSFLTDQGIECYVHGWRGRSSTDRPAPDTDTDAAGNRPYFLKVAFDFNSLIDRATPWIEANSQRLVGRILGVDDYKLPELAIGQIHTLLDVCKVLRRVTIEGYPENDAVVLHVLLNIRDVQP